MKSQTKKQEKIKINYKRNVQVRELKVHNNKNKKPKEQKDYHITIVKHLIHTKISPKVWKTVQPLACKLY